MPGLVAVDWGTSSLRAARLGMVTLPGVMTPSEAFADAWAGTMRA